MAKFRVRMRATPYAGITRVRFKGYDLSRVSIPFQNIIIDQKRKSPAPLLKNLL